MTTWQDQQPTSRRALRDRERAQVSPTVREPSADDVPKTAPDQQVWSNPPLAEPLDYATQARHPGQDDEPPLRRPRSSTPSHSTQDSPSFRMRDFSPEGRGATFAATAPVAPAPQGVSPVRESGDLDYRTSVEADRPASLRFAAAETAPPNVVTPEQASPPSPAAAPVAVAPDTVVPEDEDAPSEHTLTRRELRALRHAAEQESAPALRQEPVTGPADESVARPVAGPVDEPAQGPTPVDRRSRAAALAAEAAVPAAQTAMPAAEPAMPEAAPASSTVQVSAQARPDEDAPGQSPELAAAMSEFDALFAPKAQPDPVVQKDPDPQPQPEPAPQPAPAMQWESAPQPEPDPVVQKDPEPQPDPQPDPLMQWEPEFEPQPEPAQLVEPARPDPVFSEPARPDFASESEPLREIITAPEVYVAPVGHWSNQATINDEYAGAVDSHSHSRDLASSDAITTSALVLPSLPLSGPITGPVSRSGASLMTGSIDLPRSLAAKGVSPGRFDGQDVDSIFDFGDREDSAPSSAPVRAARAVSTHTSSQSITYAKRPRGSNLPMILSITAGVMAVGVIVLFVAGMIFKIF